MTVTLYATLDELKKRLGIDLTDTTKDAGLNDMLDTASRDVDEDTGRRFYLEDATSARVYNPYRRTVRTSEGFQLIVDDIGVAGGLIVETGSGTSFTALTDFEPGPDNATALGRPFTWLLRLWMPWSFWPQDRVRVTAQWGWPAIPPQIKQATLIQAQRLWRRKDSPEGVSTYGDFGVMRVGRSDPDYDRLIGPYKLPGFG